MSDKPNQGSGAGDRHEAARHMAEKAMDAERMGDVGGADALLSQAEKTDPSAVIDVAGDRDGEPMPSEAIDEELSTMSETVVPGSDAPSRAGITGSGSGADGQGL